MIAYVGVLLTSRMRIVIELNLKLISQVFIIYFWPSCAHAYACIIPSFNTQSTKHHNHQQSSPSHRLSINIIPLVRANTRSQGSVDVRNPKASRNRSPSITQRQISSPKHPIRNSFLTTRAIELLPSLETQRCCIRIRYSQSSE